MCRTKALMQQNLYFFYQTTTVKAKQNVVLTGEAMKEMQKQAKANKDERRMAVRSNSPVCDLVYAIPQ